MFSSRSAHVRVENFFNELSVEWHLVQRQCVHACDSSPDMERTHGVRSVAASEDKPYWTSGDSEKLQTATEDVLNTRVMSFHRSRSRCGKHLEK